MWCTLKSSVKKKHRKSLFWCIHVFSLRSFILALNTTPAIVVPVFRGLGFSPPSNKPSNAAFLERETEEGITDEGHLVKLYYPWTHHHHIVSLIQLINTQEKSCFHFWSRWKRNVSVTFTSSSVISDTGCCSEDIKKLIPRCVVEIKPSCRSFEDIW